MPVIDSDTHVIECERTWDYLEGDERRYRPYAVAGAGEDPRGNRKFWLLDGHMFSRAGGDPELPAGVKEMSDVPERIRRMDKLGVDIQILYPTFMQAAVSARPENQVALCHAYNRWMADVHKEGKGRFRWVVVPPLDSMADSLSELEFAAKNGACGVIMRGVEGARMIQDPYFFPLYQKASDLNLPICIHSGNGNVGMRDITFGDSVTVAGDTFYTGTVPVLAAFNALISYGITERFPKLRFGFLEVGSQWVPYVVRQAIRRRRLINTKGVVEDESTVLRDKRFFVGYETDDDLPYVMRWAGEDNLVLFTDFGHKDAGAEVEAIDILRRDNSAGPHVVDKMLDANARALYGI